MGVYKGIWGKWDTTSTHPPDSGHISGIATEGAFGHFEVLVHPRGAYDQEQVVEEGLNA